MSAAQRPPDDPRTDVPKTHTLGGVCAMPECYNERWLQPTPGLIVDDVQIDTRLRRYCRPCARAMDVAIVNSGGGIVVRGLW